VGTGKEDCLKGELSGTEVVVLENRVRTRVGGKVWEGTKSEIRGAGKGCGVRGEALHGVGGNTPQAKDTPRRGLATSEEEGLRVERSVGGRRGRGGGWGG